MSKVNILAIPVGELGTNCYVVWDKTAAMVVDPGDDAEAILRAVRENSLTVGCVLLTHAHFDHMGAAEAVCRETGAPLFVGASDEPALTDGRYNLFDMIGKPSVSLTADRLLRDGDEVKVGDSVFTVLETPGHTPGSICLLCGDLLLSGDTLFAGSMGRIDFPGGSLSAMRSSLRRLAALPPETRVYPGHGGGTTIGAEREDNPYVRHFKE